LLNFYCIKEWYLLEFNMGVFSLLSRATTWWNRETLGTQLYTWRKGVRVGEDGAGNVFFRDKDDRRRWVIFNGEVEASRVGAEWHGWLHRTWDEPPTEKPLPKKSWEIDHKPNLTGSLASYKPSGSLKRRDVKERRDYEAWSPE
jgi:NADH:ubiquinone oxidoreductase subunit